MKKITRSNILSWMTTPNKDPDNIINIKTKLLQKTSLLDNDAINDPTVIYVLLTMEQIIRCNVAIDTFARKKDVAPYLLVFTKTLNELNKKIEDTLGAEMLKLDIALINITNDAANHAAEALRDVLQIHNSQFTDSVSKDAYSVAMIGKYNAIMAKLSAYKNDPLVARENALTHLTHDGEITTIKGLKDSVQDEPLEPDNSLPDSLKQESDLLMKNTVSLARKEDILKQFDKLTAVFNKKIIALKYRHSLLDDKEHVNYSQAIADADSLINKLATVRNEFETTGDLSTFTQTTGDLFKAYQNRESFKLNRSTPWFRTFISKPFEQLKLFINQISEYLYKIILGPPSSSGRYKGTLFFPPETDTTKQLNAYHKAVSSICTEGTQFK